MDAMNNSRPPKPRARFWIRQIVSASLLLATGFFYSRHIDLNVVKSLLSQAELGLLAIGYGLALIVLLVRVLRWRTLLKEFSIVVNGAALFLMYLVDLLFNNFISGLSMAVRGLYISKEIGSSKLMVRLLLLDKLFDWVIPVGLGLISLLFVLLQWHASRVWAAWGAFIVVLPYAAWKLFAWLQRLAGHPGWPRRLNKIQVKLLSMAAVDLNKDRFALFSRMFVFSIVSFSIYYLVLLLLAKCFSLPVGLTELVMIDTMATISVVIPLNFAGVGTRDVALVGLLAYYRCPHEGIVLFIASLILFRLGMSFLGWLSMYVLKWKGYSIEMKF